ncbi:MAG TPA: hypothetical protein VEV61_08560 [Streptosporangiaceae bacterium]|nr:hypothetical protein [Streptosporangiaceae bacterium]
MQYAPANAFDGNPTTAWAESDPATPIGQWIQINFNHSDNLPASIGIRLLDDSAARSIANQLRVTTAAGSAVTNTITTGATQRLRVPSGRSTWLRITITGANNVVTGLPGAGISDVLIPGIKVTSYLQPAQDSAGTRAGTVDYSFGQRLSSPYLHGQPNQQASQNLDRTFVTPSAAQLKVGLMAVPNPGTALDSLIARLTPTGRAQFQVTASSTWDSLPELGAANLFARKPVLPWLAAATDPQPQLKISWQRPRTIRKIVLQPANGLAAAPTGVLIGSPAGDRLADVGLGGIVTISPPLRTNALYLNFAGESSAPGDTTSGQPAQLPLGLARLTIPALSRLHVAAASDNTSFQLSCGQGPSVAVNGHTYQTSVSGTVGDLVGLMPVKLSLCSPGESLSLPAGRQHLSATPSADFTITDVSLASQPVAGSKAESSRPRPVRVVTWQAESRAVKIGPGAASYLEVHENFNSGWKATLDGKALTPATLDGWQQAFIVPAGQGGTITLTFAPAATYHVGVIAASIALLALLAVAVGLRLRWRLRRPGRGSLDSTDLSGPSSSGTSSNASELNSTSSNSTGSNGTGSNGTGNHDLDHALFADTGYRPQAPPVGRSPGRHLGSRQTAWSAIISPHGMTGHGGRHRQVKAPVGSSFITLIWRSPSPKTRAQVAHGALPYLPLLGVILLAGGPIAVAVPVLAVLERWRQRWLPAVAFAGMLAAGVISATARTPTNLGSGPFSAAAQVCALVALAAALMPGNVGRTSGIAYQAGKMIKPAYGATGGQHDPPAQQRFTAIDELACYFGTADEPFNIHLEIRLPGRLDEQAFRLAVNAAMLANPRTSSRRARHSTFGASYTWEPTSQLDVDPVSFSTVADVAELDRTRIAFISRSPSIDSSPPALLLVASGPEVDHVILNAHHAAMDGLSWLDLLRDIGRHYRAIMKLSHTAIESPVIASASRSTVPSAASHQPGIDPAAAHTEGPAAGVGMLGHAVSRVLSMLPRHRWPARICADGGSQHGYGLQLIQLPAVPVVPEFSTGGRATLNEVLITALIATIGRWNLEHDRPARWIRITTPANARTPDEPHASGNLSRLVTISAMPPSPGSDLGTLLADVARQARRARQDAAPQIGVAGRILAGAPCPTAVKRLAVQIALRTAGRLVCDTAMLTNLGNVTDPPDFGLEGLVTMAFSAQAQMPRGLTVGVITAGGKLQLTLRYSKALLNETAAGKLGQQFLQALAQLANIADGGESAQRDPGSYSQAAGTASQS